MIALVQTYSFDGDGAVKLFKGEEWNEALGYMKESFNKYVATELKDNSELDEALTYCDEDYGYARLTWTDGKYAEWQILNVCDEI